jgi:hypothetical protein
MIAGPGGFIGSADVAAGLTMTFRPRFNVAFEQAGHIFEIPLDGAGVVGAPGLLSILPDNVRPATVFAKAPTQFFTVWQCNSGAAADIHGRRHAIP